MAKTREGSRGDDESDKNPDQVAERLCGFHHGDDLAHNQWLSESGDCSGGAENDDQDENALVLEQKRHQLTKSGSRGAIVSVSIVHATST